MSFLKFHEVVMDLEEVVDPFYMPVFHVKVEKNLTLIHDLSLDPWLQSQPIINDVKLPRSIIVDYIIVEELWAWATPNSSLVSRYAQFGVWGNQCWRGATGQQAFPRIN